MKWIKSEDQLPEFNVSVLVYIPEEDHHITTGMWDISKKWVLLDEYRVPESQVTYWMPMIKRPKDGKYIKTTITEHEQTSSFIISKLQKENYFLKTKLKNLSRDVGEALYGDVDEDDVNKVLDVVVELIERED